MSLLQSHLPFGTGRALAMPIVLGIFVVATVVVLFLGLGGMIAGGDFNRKYGNKLMIARVSCQALAVASLGLMFMMR